MNDREVQPPRVVSDSELEILKTLWQRAPIKIAELRDALNAAGRAWAYNTVQTLLNRLESKGFVGSEKKGRAFSFFPTLTQADFIRDHMEDLANRVCEGAQAPLVLALAKQSHFTKQEIREFRELLDQLEDETGSQI